MARAYMSDAVGRHALMQEVKLGRAAEWQRRPGPWRVTDMSDWAENEARGILEVTEPLHGSTVSITRLNWLRREHTPFAGLFATYNAEHALVKALEAFIAS